MLVKPDMVLGHSFRVGFLLCWLSAAGFCASVLTACGSCGGDPQNGSTADPPATEGQWGILTGVVRFAEGAELPSFPAPDREQDPPEGCPPPQQTDRQPVQLGEGRGLHGISVVAGAFTGEAPPDEPKTHEIRIENCRLSPQTIVATGPSQSGERAGDVIRVVNGGSVPFVPALPSDPMRTALVEGASAEYTVTTGGAQTVHCPFPSPTCGRADIIVAYHPVIAVTDENGAFRIENVPPGQDIEFHAWHPLFGEASQTVNIAAGESEEIELTIGPAVQPAAPEATDEEAGDEPSEGEAEADPTSEGAANTLF